MALNEPLLGRVINIFFLFVNNLTKARFLRRGFLRRLLTSNENSNVDIALGAMASLVSEVVDHPRTPPNRLSL